MMKDNSEKRIPNKIEAQRPEPILANIDVVAYDKQMDPGVAVEALMEGYSVLIMDYYSSGLAVLNALKKQVKKKYRGKSFKDQRDFRNAFHDISQRVLFKISKHRLTVEKGPEIGWFKILYPELEEFLLPVSKVQGLNSSWQWYEKGIQIPVVNRKIHPWYGTYFPTRFDHLGIFDHWLQHYKGEKKSALDVGIGSGILSFQMLNFGFEKVYGTDFNPNVILGLEEDVKKNKLESKLELIHGDLFEGIDLKTELIVFNPPWLPATYELEGLDSAIYYKADLFTRFFAEVGSYLKPGGKIVLLFSNLAEVTGVSKVHPIKKELEEGNRFFKEYFVQKKVQAASKKTKRNQHWRNDEMVELWVLREKEEEAIGS